MGERVKIAKYGDDGKDSQEALAQISKEAAWEIACGIFFFFKLAPVFE
jgi:hypothetical protein